MGKKQKKIVTEEMSMANLDTENFTDAAVIEKKPRKEVERTPHGQPEIDRFNAAGVMDELIVSYNDFCSEVEAQEVRLEEARAARKSAHRACVLDLRHKDRMRAKAGINKVAA